jgi:methionyl-tRNA synthetase
MNDPATAPATFYITTAIDYPNSVPHMGHAYEKTLADFYARWYRLRGLDTYFLTGVDEHGQKIQEAADKAGQSPQEFVDGKATAFETLCETLQISNDDFIRTSSKRHRQFAQELYQTVLDKDDIYKGNYEGDYCISCESFYTAAQLVDGKCPVHDRLTERVQEESYFFRLGKYQDWIRQHIQDNEDFIYPPERRNEILSRLNDEIRDLSVSRSTFDWGVPVPNDPEHVMYVWFDALSNYISALREPRDLLNQYWPADVHVIGKDIIWFHTVIWPCMLHSAGYPIPRQVYVHGFILDQDGRKMSKHLDNVADPLEIVKQFSPEVLRYYFVRVFSSGHDGKFSLDDLRERYHSELGNDLGNLVLRVIKLVEGRLGGSAAAPDGFEPELDASAVIGQFSKSVDAREHHRALDALWSFVRRTNAYLNENAPWKEEDDAVFHRVLYNSLYAMRTISYLIQPVMPNVAASIAAQLGFTIDGQRCPKDDRSEYKVKRSDPLFPRIEDPAKDKKNDQGKVADKGAGKKQKSPTPDIDPFAKLRIVVGRIEDVQDHPDAEALYVFRVRMAPGDEGEHRTICAGLRNHVDADDLRDRKVLVLANLKPAKLRGIDSQGMVLASDRKDGGVVPVDPGNAEVGEEIRVEGIEPQPKTKLSSKDFGRAPLAVKGGRVVYDGKPLQTTAGDVTCDAEDGATVR